MLSMMMIIAYEVQGVTGSSDERFKTREVGNVAEW
jgi:hypothetical protein